MSGLTQSQMWIFYDELENQEKLRYTYHLIKHKHSRDAKLLVESLVSILDVDGAVQVIAGSLRRTGCDKEADTLSEFKTAC